MYYWIRTGNWLDVASFVILCLLWCAGGFLIVSQSFNLKPREKLVAGPAAGFLLFIVSSNLLAQVLPLSIAYWGSAGIILLTGLILRLLAGKKFTLDLDLLREWPMLASLGVIILVFTLILRGLAIFDDYYHLPMISVMATGDIPPHFYLDPTLHLPYHYGLQVFAAGMVRLGGFYPWSAWDISRAVVLGFACVLGWLWIRRLTGSQLAAYLGSGLLVLGGGTRWLLLLVPQRLLVWMGANLHMDISGMTAGGSLVGDLINRWPMDGAGPFPFPFAFANGLLEPLNMQLGATGAMWEMTILLLLLLAGRRRRLWLGAVILGLILASLALSAEHVFAAVFLGLGIVLATQLISNAARHRSGNKALLVGWGIPLALSGILALFQGGYITGGFLSLLARLTGRTYPMVTTDFQGFSLRWPPAVPTGHLGPLSLFDPGQIGILLAEAGPALILLVAGLVYWLRRPHRPHWLVKSLAAGSIFSLAFPIFFRYGLDFDITRLVGASLWLGLALSFPVIWRWVLTARTGLRLLTGLGYSAAVFAGVMMLGVELIAIPAPQTTYYLQYRESEFLKNYWNRLEPGAQILDSRPERAVLLFGRASLAAQDVYKRSAGWQELVADPDPLRVAAAGYSYVYMDDQWWQRLPPGTQSAYAQPCVQQVAELTLPGNSFRKLLKVQACRP
ncbi:MAG: hypothetical protein ACM3H7_06305 [Acidobacteriaceae bacterium]